MISRGTAQVLGEAYQSQFSGHRRTRGGYYGGSQMQFYVNHDALYDYFFSNNYPAWICNASKTLKYKRSIKEWVMKLHTGESLVPATPNWDWKQRQTLGQQYLEQLAEDLLQDFGRQTSDLVIKGRKDTITKVTRNLELDGYRFVNRTLLRPEEDVLDVEAEKGVLHDLMQRLDLADRETAFHHLNLSEEHFVAERWDDSIGNSRKFMEAALSAVAKKHSERLKEAMLSDRTADRPSAVRDYLEREGLLEAKEKQLISSVYGLLSETGAHPYMAANDQARLLRHLSLTVSQFVLLRLEGALGLAV